MEETKLLDLAKKLTAFYKDACDAMPSAANLIDQLHAGENAHSRILCMLLRYRRQGTYPVLSSLIDLALQCIMSADRVELVSPCISCEQEHIDVLVEDPGRFALIIENKIHYANDQPGQIERYIDKIINHGMPLENIYVVYLTRDGDQKVTPER